MAFSVDNFSRKQFRMRQQQRSVTGLRGQFALFRSRETRRQARSRIQHQVCDGVINGEGCFTQQERAAIIADEESRSGWKPPLLSYRLTGSVIAGGAHDRDSMVVPWRKLDQ